MSKIIKVENNLCGFNFHFENGETKYFDRITLLFKSSQEFNSLMSQIQPQEISCIYCRKIIQSKFEIKDYICSQCQFDIEILNDLERIQNVK